MRILMLNNEFPPLGGGTATVNEELLKLFASDPKYNIELITSSASNADEKTQFSPKIQIHHLSVGSNCLHHATNSDLVRYAIRSFLLGRRLINRERFDLIFAWSALPAGAVALALSKSSGIPFIVRVCGPDIPGFEDRYKWIYRLLTPLIKCIWNNAKVLIAKCSNEAELIRKTLPTKKITIIPNGVNISAFALTSKKVSENLQSTIRLLCVGRLILRKGQSDLFKAVRLAKQNGANLTLTLIGDGDEHQRYLKEIESLGLKEIVELKGYVPRSNLPKHYNSADVFVLPSYNEGMSVSLLEAMAAGLGVVASQEALAGIELNHIDDTLKFQAGEFERLGHIILRISKDKDLLPRLRELSMSTVKDMGWDKVFKRYQTLIEGFS